MFMVYGPCPNKVLTHLDRPVLIEGLWVCPPSVHITFVIKDSSLFLIRIWFSTVWGCRFGNFALWKVSIGCQLFLESICHFHILKCESLSFLYSYLTVNWKTLICEQNKTFADLILAFEEHSLKYFSILRHLLDRTTNHLIKKKKIGLEIIQQ